MSSEQNPPEKRPILAAIRRHSSAAWGVVAVVAFAGIGLLGLLLWQIAGQRADVLEAGRQQTANLASSLIQHAELTFQTADAILIGMVERFEHDAIDPNGRQRLDAWLSQEARRSSQFASFLIVDSDGAIVAGSVAYKASTNISDREYFAYHRTHDDRDLHISIPLQGRVSDGWKIPLTRRLNHADGTFAGVAVASINLTYFQNLYDKLKIGENGAVLLASLDGTLLVRRPFVEANIGRDMSQSSLFRHLEQAPSGSLEIDAFTDGVRRLSSFERGHRYPLVIAVAQDKNELLETWRRDSRWRLGIALVVVLLFLLLGAFVWRLTKTLAANAEKLGESNARLDTTLSSMSLGVSMFDGDGKLMVWNNRYLEMYGMSPEIVHRGAGIRDIVEHRKQAANPALDVDSYVGELRQQLIDEGKSTSISRLQDGRMISVANMATAGGGWVALHEDVTARIRQEQEIFDQATELARTNMRFEAALSNMTQGLCLFDGEKRLVIANSRFREMYDLPDELVLPGTPLPVILQHHADRGVHSDLTADEHAATIPAIAQQHFMPGDGREILVKRSPTQDGGWVATHEDVTEQRRQERLIAEKATELEVINDRFDAALGNMTQGISMFDGQRRLVVWNARFAALYRLPPNLLKVGTPHAEIVAYIRSRGIAKGGEGAADGSHAPELGKATDDQASSRVDELADGRLILLSRQPMSGGGWLTTHEDITERRRAETEIIHLARHDVLTGLANRAEFNARLGDASRRIKRYGGAITVMMLDLDKFKAVNDRLGHAAGDQLLVEVARLLKASVRETDLVARLGGDEFAIIQEGGTHQSEGAIALSVRIINSLRQPFDLNGHQANIGASIGIALAPEHGTDPEELLRKADLALYNVKASGRNDYRLFQPDMLDFAHFQQSAESELREAIARDEFQLRYQSVVDAKTGLICGVEALVRWQHPTRGLIGPDQFIPLAESTGLIVPLGAWVLLQACKDAVSWPAHIKVAVNISAVQFEKGNLFELVLGTLLETGLAPERLELEITETSLLENQEQHLAMIRQLKNLGISLALDDFGTGYSSINYLTNFPFDKIKIDKLFTQGVLERRDYKAVVVSTLALAQGLGTITTSEGVETKEQFAYMREAGVDLVQGYLFGRPVPASQLDLGNAQQEKVA
jgi:diguanylate cyclase (GGDEF)-like protein